MAEAECSAKRSGVGGRRWWLGPGQAVRSAEASPAEIQAARALGLQLRSNPFSVKAVPCWQCNPENAYLLDTTWRDRYVYLCAGCGRGYAGGVDVTDYSGGPFAGSLHAGVEVPPVDEYHTLRFSGWGHEEAVEAAYPRAVPKEDEEPLPEPDGFWDRPIGEA